MTRFCRNSAHSPPQFADNFAQLAGAPRRPCASSDEGETDVEDSEDRVAREAPPAFEPVDSTLNAVRLMIEADERHRTVHGVPAEEEASAHKEKSPQSKRAGKKRLARGRAALPDLAPDGAAAKREADVAEEVLVLTEEAEVGSIDANVGPPAPVARRRGFLSLFRRRRARVTHEALYDDDGYYAEIAEPEPEAEIAAPQPKYIAAEHQPKPENAGAILGDKPAKKRGFLKRLRKEAPEHEPRLAPVERPGFADAQAAYSASEQPQGDDFFDVSSEPGLLMRLVRPAFERVRARVVAYEPKRRHIAVIAFMAVMIWRPWLIPGLVLLLVLVAIIVHLTLGPDRVAELLDPLREKAAKRFPDKAAELHRRAQLGADKVESWVEKLPARWRDNLTVPDLGRSGEPQFDGEDPFSKLAASNETSEPSEPRRNTGKRHGEHAARA